MEVWLALRPKGAKASDLFKFTSMAQKARHVTCNVLCLTKETLSTYMQGQGAHMLGFVSGFFIMIGSIGFNLGVEQLCR